MPLSPCKFWFCPPHHGPPRCAGFLNHGASPNRLPVQNDINPGTLNPHPALATILLCKGAPGQMHVYLGPVVIWLGLSDSCITKRKEELSEDEDRHLWTSLPLPLLDQSRRGMTGPRQSCEGFSLSHTGSRTGSRPARSQDAVPGSGSPSTFWGFSADVLLGSQPELVLFSPQEHQLFEKAVSCPKMATSISGIPAMIAKGSFLGSDSNDRLRAGALTQLDQSFFPIRSQPQSRFFFEPLSPPIRRCGSRIIIIRPSLIPSLPGAPLRSNRLINTGWLIIFHQDDSKDREAFAVILLEENEDYPSTPVISDPQEAREKEPRTKADARANKLTLLSQGGSASLV
ncbi:predicted protein [Uncinocarpus reesii 1704]|uniref:Uncharacterized protein n=1 Tax=Uncinocarpus reesii (strain UAMH 1704) TaxID=336963 RepID=C4JJ31_UNCRE|nr:uncharacterized protein UREG_01638 [Uncinocarpus reesii 1704]EEP76789.1 predicted protein [Uncinocarpus reesii 1704]